MSAGFKVFTAGDVLTAADVNDYLMEQAVMVFDDAAARDTAIGTANFNEGMTSYNKDTAQLELYDGTDWVNISPASDTGLIHIKTESFSAVTAVSVNDVFSADYQNYRVIFSGGVASGNPNLEFRYRVAGSDNSTSAYDNRSGQVSSTFAFFNSAVGAQFRLSAVAADTIQVLDIRNPFAVAPTNSTILANYSGFSSFGGGTFTSSTSFTGFTYFVATSTITGVIRVYGYKD